MVRQELQGLPVPLAIVTLRAPFGSEIGNLQDDVSSRLRALKDPPTRSSGQMESSDGRARHHDFCPSYEILTPGRDDA